MRRALGLAAQGVGRTGDNPSVGCVIVRDGAVIAEARTADGGRPHAEEQAVAQTDVRGATAYVTLEPCAKRSNGTASCADRLIEAGVTRVVIAASDPHPFASGVGVERLRAAGLQVEIGVLEDEAAATLLSFLSRFNDLPAHRANANARARAMRDLPPLVARLQALNCFAPGWSAQAAGFTPVSVEPGLRIFQDADDRDWAVFDEDGLVVRVQVDVSTGPISKVWSAYQEDEHLKAWTASFDDAQTHIDGLLGAEPSYAGYFEDPGFPENEDALYIASWRSDDVSLMLQFHGVEYFDHPAERFRLSLAISRRDLSGTLARLWRARLIRPWQ